MRRLSLASTVPLLRPSLAAVLFSSLAAGPFSSLAAAQGARIVRPDADPGFPDVQSAVDAAVDGDVILLAPGVHTPFVIDGKTLRLVGGGWGDVFVSGTSEVRNVPAGGFVSVAGVTLQGEALSSTSTPALRLIDNAGDVRFQGCTITGGELGDYDCMNRYGPTVHGGNAVEMQANLRAVFAGCTIRGGDGSDFPYESGCYYCYGGVGGHGVVAEASPAALYDCVVLGGEGGDCQSGGGDAGSAYLALGLGLFASGTEFRGGDGGDWWDSIPGPGGAGGDGLFITGTEAVLLGSSLSGGQGGDGVPYPPDGLPSAGDGQVTTLPGTARRVSLEVFGDDLDPLEFEVHGEAGDEVHLLAGQATDFAFAPELSGVWLVDRRGFTSAIPVGTVPASGVLRIGLKLPRISASRLVDASMFQAVVVDGAGAAWLASPLHPTRIARSAQPDCNFNLVTDYFDVIEGTSLDCQPDLVPDECQVWLGDCNWNGIPDECDLADGTSQDLNGNGEPDECERAGLTWHVDTSAPPGGDGSPALPFQALGEAFAVALPTDAIVVQDGVYSGPENRELDFAGRALEVRSADGPAGCVIDCGGRGRAFVATGPNAYAHVIGFTVKNGSASAGAGMRLEADDVLVAHCSFEDCTASQGGGGAYLAADDCRVIGCAFSFNAAALGGGLRAAVGSCSVEDCSFVENVAAGGGGASVSGPARVSRCRFLGNVAGSLGGGLRMISGTPDTAIDHCVFDGNTAERGGGVSLAGSFRVLDCTFAHNHATDRGGALRLDGGVHALANSVLWNNSAGDAGGAVSLGTSELLVTHSLLEGGPAAVHVHPTSTLTWLAGNLDLDPAFVDPDGPDDDPATATDNDLHLGAGSPCIDAGYDAAIAPDASDLDGDGDVGEAVPFDLDGALREVDVSEVPDTGTGAPPLVDLGAYERRP